MESVNRPLKMLEPSHHQERTSNSNTNANGADSDERTKKAAGYPGALMERLRLQRANNESFCDMVLSAEGHSFRVHK